jgi:integrase/recombinase XerD
MTPLRRRMLEDMGIRNLAENTKLSYLQQISAYARHFGRSPEELGPEDVHAYQAHLVEVRKLSPGSVGIATSALRFLYKVTLKRDWAPEDIPMPKKPFRLPVILSREEVMRLLECVESLKHRTILTTAYAAGLRLSEATHLRITDLDSQRMVLRVEQGKARKDRYVMLSPRLLEALRSYWKVARPRTWLFPGDLPEQPITKGAVEAACQKARRAHPALAASRLRHAPAGSRHRCAHDPVAARTSQPGDDLTLPEGRHQHRVCDCKSVRLAARASRAARRTESARAFLRRGLAPPRAARGGGHLPPDRAGLPPRAC